MPATQRNPPQGDGNDAIWHEHAARIRELYFDRKRPRKDCSLLAVKATMESEHGFPVFPKHIWEVKLKNTLGFRKKVQKNDWPRIHQHYEQRKIQGKESKILLNNELIEWRRAWKEMRRSGAVRHSSLKEPLSPLPPGIELRTPSPDLGVASLNTGTGPRVVPEVNWAILTQADQVRGKSINPFDSTHIKVHELGSPMMAADVIGTLRNMYALSCTDPNLDPNTPIQIRSLYPYALAIRGIPVVTFVEEMTDLIQRFALASISPTGPFEKPFGTRMGSYTTGHCSSPSPSPKVMTTSSVTSPWTFTGNGQSLSQSTSEPLTRKLQAIRDLIEVIYLCSNDLVHRYAYDVNRLSFFFVNLVQASGTLSASSTTSHFRDILEASWRNLMATFVWLTNIQQEHFDYFLNFLDFGIQHCWLDKHNNLFWTCLECTSKIGRTDLVQKLGALYENGWWFNASTRLFLSISAALQNNHVECAKVLIASTAPKDLTNLGRELGFSIQFLDADNDQHMDFFDAILDKIDVFIEFGSLPRSNPHITGYSYHRFGHIILTPFYKRWPLSLLDYCYYFVDVRIYQKMALHVKSPESQITRAGFWAALRCPETVRDYLITQSAVSPSDMPQWLELLLLESLVLNYPRFYRGSFRRRRKIDYAPIETLIDLVNDIHLSSLFGQGRSVLLELAIGKVAAYGPCMANFKIISLLLRKGAAITPAILARAVQKRGTSLLKFLIPRVKDLPRQGPLALSRAARLRNLAAVELLISAGVDPNGFVDRRHQITVLAHSVFSESPPVKVRKQNVLETMETMQILIDHGAKLRCYDFLRMALYRLADASYEPLWRYVIDQLDDLPDPTQPSEFLLDTCAWSELPLSMNYYEKNRRIRLGLFRHLFGKGAKIRPGSPLVACILLKGGINLAEDLLQAGAEVDAYTTYPSIEFLAKGGNLTPLQAASMLADEEMVTWLLQKGANPSSPARGFRGRTALQAICDFDAVTPEGNERKMRVIDSLLDSTDNPREMVNAAPAPSCGFTALQIAAHRGDLNVAVLLLSLGADVNAPACEKRGHTALDGAAYFGRLDMVKLLLNSNALSAYRGTTGYDGAVRAAEREGHRVIANLILEHYKNNLRLGIPNPFLTQSDRDYREYHYTESDMDEEAGAVGSFQEALAFLKKKVAIWDPIGDQVTDEHLEAGSDNAIGEDFDKTFDDDSIERLYESFCQDILVDEEVEDPGEDTNEEDEDSAEDTIEEDDDVSRQLPGFHFGRRQPWC